MVEIPLFRSHKMSWFASGCHLYHPQTKFPKVMFLHMSVCPHEGHAWQGASVVGGAWQGDMGGRGHAWQEGACMAGGGCAWQGGMHGRGCAWQGACVAGGMHGGGVHGRGACVAGGVHPLADTMRYGQWEGGTHPTGMHSCFNEEMLLDFAWNRPCSLTDLILLNVPESTLENMLVSGLESIWNATAQWWFSSGEMSLYRIARSVLALIWYLKKRGKNTGW